MKRPLKIIVNANPSGPLFPTISHGACTQSSKGKKFNSRGRLDGCVWVVVKNNVHDVHPCTH
jgi:hypothetical protein